MATYKDPIVYIDSLGNFSKGKTPDPCLLYCNIETISCARSLIHNFSDAQHQSFILWLNYQLYLYRWKKKVNAVVGEVKIKDLL